MIIQYGSKKIGQTFSQRRWNLPDIIYSMGLLIDEQTVNIEGTGLLY